LVQAAWSAVRRQYGGSLRERYRYKTITKLLGKKKTIVAIARRLAELMYSMLKSGTEYKPRPWKGTRDDPVCLTEGVMSA
jgi:transposase